MAGVCAAITAARAGVRVVLIQDRPVLGGNASSEVRLWILGATSHMGNNNRYSREGGVIDEILVENLWRNPEGNPVILDTVILEKVRKEPNITLLLNTAVYDVEKSAPDTISHVMAFCSQNSTFYEISARLFCDASGDGLVAYRAGAAFRVGAEEEEEFGERFVPDVGRYGELLGHSIYFYSKDTGQPVAFVPPAYALHDVEAMVPRYRNIDAGLHGCKLWWLEYGGRLDTVHDTERIKWELWSVVWGVWDHIKNSGKYPEAANLTLEWVGIIPGKRESRRFEGLYTLTQQDIIGQTHFPDAVAHGGWAIDLHPADGVYSALPGCTQYHSKGVYQIPYRCLVSRDIRNLFYAGRIMSATHVAHGSSRVMATSALCAQAVGMAAAQCLAGKLFPADLTEPKRMSALQQSLDIAGQSIPGTRIDPAGNLAAEARISASSALEIGEIPFDGPWLKLDYSVAQMLPMQAGTGYELTIEADAAADTNLDIELRRAERPENYTPEVLVEKVSLALRAGEQRIRIPLKNGLPADGYGFVTFLRNEQVRLRTSECRITGIVSLWNKFNRDVNNHGRQTPPEGSGIDSFEFWCPERRPGGRNIAMQVVPALGFFGPEQVVNGIVRPYVGPNAWVASPCDKAPALRFDWEKPQKITNITLYWDTDYDHAMESVQMGHPERVVPFCVRNYTVADAEGHTLCRVEGNHQTINRLELDSGTEVSSLIIRLEHPSERVPAALFQILIR